MDRRSWTASVQHLRYSGFVDRDEFDRFGESARQDEFDRECRRLLRAAVQETRKTQRQIKDLEATQRVTAQKLQAFIDSLHSGDGRG